ncbi:hypothetical protein AB1K62_14040 [Parasphingorhabdus sp. JC815]|uniref:hypothetical protein n=1 Tax=Parasphingorhabdus sp. JC815 TaxID=3232140 RepID=UPI003459CFF3
MLGAAASAQASLKIIIGQLSGRLGIEFLGFAFRLAKGSGGPFAPMRCHVSSIGDLLDGSLGVCRDMTFYLGQRDVCNMQAQSIGIDVAKQCGQGANV